MLEKISGRIIRFRWVIIVFWLAIAALILFKAPILSEVAKGDQSSFLPKNSDTLKAGELMKKLYPEKGEGSSLVLTMHREGTLSDADRAYGIELEKYLVKNGSRFHIREVLSPFTQEKFSEIMISKNKTAAYMLVNLNIPGFKDVTNEVVEDIRTLEQGESTGTLKNVPALPAGLTVNLTGDAPLGEETMTNVHNSMDLTTKITLVLVLVVLIAIYRSPVAPFVPLMTVGLSFLISRGVVAELTNYGLKVSSFTETFMMAVLFGAGTDYCLLLASRFREEIVQGKAPREALKATMPKTGIAIISSGSTVIVGFLGMVLAKFGLYNTTGPSIAIGVAISILAVLTLTPAVIAVLGERIFWPAHPSKTAEKEREGSRFWNRVSRAVTLRPVQFILVCLVVFVPFMVSTLGINRSFDQLSDLPKKSDAVKGFDVIKANFNQGEMLPVKVILRDSGDMWSNSSLQVVDDIAKNILKVDGVADVRTATRPKGEPVSQLSSGLDTMDQGSQKIAQGISQGSDQMGQLASGTQAAVDGITAIRSSLKTSDGKILSLNGSTSDFKNKLGALNQGLTQLKAALDTEGRLLSGTATAFSLLAKTKPDLVDDEGYLNGMKSLQGAQMYNAGAASGIAKILEELKDASPMLTDAGKGIAGTKGDIRKLDEALAKVQSGLMQIKDGQSKTVNGLKDASTNLTKISSGISNVRKDAADSQGKDNRLNNVFYLPAGALEKYPQLKEGMVYYISPDGKGITLEVILSQSPYSDKALNSIKEIRKAVAFTIKNTALKNAEFHLTGTSAAYSELRDITADDFAKVIFFVLLGIFIVLVVLLRSLTAPIYLIFTIILSYATTMGITYLVFQKLLGFDGLTWSVPFFSFCILVALGVDYNIFLMTRVKEEYVPGDVKGGIQRALASTGKIITSCGIIMAGTFGALVASPVTQMVEIGFTAVVGLLLDTFIIRCLLVPAIAVKFGELNWWPGSKVKVVHVERDSVKEKAVSLENL